MYIAEWLVAKQRREAISETFPFRRRWPVAALQASLEAAAKEDLGNRAFWWQLYVGVVMAYARGLFSRQQTIIDQRLQQIVIPNVDQFYRDIRELRRQTPPLALPPGIEADNEVDEVDQYLREYGTDISYPPETL